MRQPSLKRRRRNPESRPPAPEQPEPAKIPGPESAKTSFELPAESEALPQSYGQTRVVLLPVDPYLVHAYWEITPQDREEVTRRVAAAGKGAEPQASLRFYDITNTVSDVLKAGGQFDVDIQLEAGSWYVHLWSPEKSYFVDLGLRTAEGNFVALARSNIVHTPRAWPSTNVDTNYLPIAASQPQPELRVLAPPSPVPRVTVGVLPEVRREQEPEQAQVTRLMNMAESLWRKLAELYSRQPRPEGAFRRDPHGHQPRLERAFGREPRPADTRRRSYGTEDFSDLTEMSENIFIAGISSWKG